MLFAFLLAVVAARPQCGPRVGGPPCATVAVAVDPGTCATLDDPCGGDWSALGAFALCDTFAGLWAEVDRRPAGNTVRVCADAGVPIMEDEPVVYGYVDDAGVARAGTLLVTTGQELAVEVTADPKWIENGASSQLQAVVTGGVPPYTYVWDETATLSSLTVPDPVATPTARETYSVHVTDSRGTLKTASKTVLVIPVMTITATPDTIDRGLSSQLVIDHDPDVMEGFYLSYSPDLASSRPQNIDYWHKATSPLYSTSYYIWWPPYDFDRFVIDSVRVFVRMEIDVTADPELIIETQSTQLGVDVPVGGAWPRIYSYEWTPAATLDDPTIATPTAAPTDTTTYSVTVTDWYGQKASGSVTVNVIPLPSASASR